MSAVEESPVDGLLTIDELANRVGMTVRTTRYYATLGLIPPPIRSGRMAYYDDTHLSRLEMVRALQDHGFTLQAIEGYMSSLPVDADVEELVLRRSMLIPWDAQALRVVTRAELEGIAGRKLSGAEVELLVTLGALDRVGRKFETRPALRVSLELIELDIPVEGMQAAGAAIGRHMDALAAELTEVMKRDVVAPFRATSHTPEEVRAFEITVGRLRQLTIEALVTQFQRAANEVTRRSLTKPS